MVSQVRPLIGLDSSQDKMGEMTNFLEQRPRGRYVGSYVVLAVLTAIG